ncbi:MAG: hypothetical protein H6Q41_5042 [Deltaproteobacteria bacterium]|nr:hypothetical protein [Deltaproteobacteria bacterium]
MQEVSSKVEKQSFLVRQGESEKQEKLELQIEARREFGFPQNSEVEEKRGGAVSMMAEAQSEVSLSQNPGAVKMIPVPPRKHLLSVLLLKILFRSKRSFQTSSKRQEFYSTNISFFS